jgi:hypothetical protein
MENYTYEVTENVFGMTVIIRTNQDGTITSVPAVDGNSDYQEYLASLEKEA